MRKAIIRTYVFGFGKVGQLECGHTVDIPDETPTHMFCPDCVNDGPVKPSKGAFAVGVALVS